MEQFTTEISRSNVIESTHKIKILLTNCKGEVILSSGNDNDYIYPRSSIKIFQAIPFIRSNLQSDFKFNSKCIALSCSSHRGESFHLKELNNWFKKIGINRTDLKCGIHSPLNIKANEKLLWSNKKANELHNNCAGKHLAMITSCINNNYDIDGYLDFEHPHQKNIRDIFKKFSNKEIQKKNFGIDGCSAPQYAFKIKDIAKMLSNLIKSYENNFNYSSEVKLLINSVILNPNYIGGTDSLDSNIMLIGNKKIFCKGGAEGVFLFADLKKQIVGVIKIIDGNERVIPSIIYDLFKKFKIFDYKELSKFKKIYDFQIKNHAKIIVGSIKTKL